MKEELIYQFQAYKKGYNDGFNDRMDEVIRKFIEYITKEGLLHNGRGERFLHLKEEQLTKILEDIKKDMEE